MIKWPSLKALKYEYDLKEESKQYNKEFTKNLQYLQKEEYKSIFSEENTKPTFTEINDLLNQPQENMVYDLHENFNENLSTFNLDNYVDPENKYNLIGNQPIPLEEESSTSNPSTPEQLSYSNPIEPNEIINILTPTSTPISHYNQHTNHFIQSAPLTPINYDSDLSQRSVKSEPIIKYQLKQLPPTIDPRDLPSTSTAHIQSNSPTSSIISNSYPNSYSNYDSTNYDSMESD